ncbi:MAG: hypothetical protein U0R68_08650 [Candidatus Nanopelagicales bacterium]
MLKPIWWGARASPLALSAMLVAGGVSGCALFPTSDCTAESGAFQDGVLNDPILSAMDTTKAEVVRISACDASEGIPAINLQWSDANSVSIERETEIAARASGWHREESASGNCWTKELGDRPAAAIVYTFNGLSVLQFRVVKPEDGPCGTFP